MSFWISPGIWSKNCPTYLWNIPQIQNQQFMKEFLSFGGLGRPGYAPGVCWGSLRHEEKTFGFASGGCVFFPCRLEISSPLGESLENFPAFGWAKQMMNANTSEEQGGGEEQQTKIHHTWGLTAKGPNILPSPKGRGTLPAISFFTGDMWAGVENDKLLLSGVETSKISAAHSRGGTWRQKVFFLFLPYSWKWRMGPYKTSFLHTRAIFHWTMILGGRVPDVFSSPKLHFTQFNIEAKLIISKRNPRRVSLSGEPC